MPGPNQVSVWNKALDLLAVKPIAAVDEATVQAGVIARNWDSVRRSALGSMNWGFARVPAGALALVAGYTSPANWLYGYQYPVKAVAVWKVFNPAIVSNPSLIPPSSIDQMTPNAQNIADYLSVGEPFQHVYDPTYGQIILSNCAGALAEYTFDVEDTEVWSDDFVEMVAFGLAAQAAMPLTGDQDLVDKWAKAYLNAGSEAKRQNKAEDNSERFGSGSTLDSRV